MIKEMSAAFLAFFLVSAAVSAAYPEAELGIETDFDSVCPCSTITSDDLSVTIKNMGDEEAMYSLSLSLPEGGSWSGFIIPEVTLAGGQESTVPVFVTPSCFVKPGKYAVSVSAHSEVSGKTSSAETEIEIGKCRWVEIEADSYEVCQGKESSFVVKLENQGADDERIKLSTNVEWAKFPSGVFEIESGKTADAALVMQPPKDLEGLGEIVISAVSESSYARNELTVDAEVLRCYAGEFEVSPDMVEVCPCKSADFGLVISNTGLYDDNYTVSYGEVSETVGIKSGAEAALKISAGMPCETDDGEYPLDITISSASPYSPLEYSGTISVFPFDECYSVAVLSEDETPATISVGESQTYKITVGNKGKFAQAYDISATGPEWVHLSEEKVELQPGYGAEIYMYAAPGYAVEPGNYTVTVSSSSAESGERSSVAFAMAVVSDFGPSNASNINMNISIPTGQAAGGSGDVWPQIAMISVLAIGVVFILILRFVVMMK